MSIKFDTSISSTSFDTLQKSASPEQKTIKGKAASFVAQLKSLPDKLQAKTLHVFQNKTSSQPQQASVDSKRHSVIKETKTDSTFRAKTTRKLASIGSTIRSFSTDGLNALIESTSARQKPESGSSEDIESKDFLEKLPAGVDKQEILKIREAITPQLKELSKQAKASGGAMKISKHTMTALPKSVTVTSDGKVYMHAKVQLGKGLEKTVKLNVEVFTGEKKVRMSDSTAGSGVKEWVSKEPGFFNKFKGTKGIAKATTYTFVSQKPGKIDADRPKLGMLMNAYNAGGIDSLLTKPEFTNSRTAQMKALHDLASAVGAMHKKNCTHGDLKTGNLLANFDKDNPSNIEVGLSDFGMSIDFSSDLSKQEVVEGGGTPGFQGPEVNRDIKDISPEQLKEHFEGLDRYAFGMTAFSILTGVNDKAGLTAFREQRWKNYTSDDIEKFVSDLRGKPGVTNEVVNLLKRSLDAKPENRPPMTEWIPHLKHAMSVASKIES